VEARLVPIQHHQILQREPVELAREFRADGAAGPRHEDDLAGEVAGDLVDVGGDLRPSEQVGDVELVKAGEVDAAAHDVAGRGHHEGLEPGVVGDARDLTHHGLRRRRNGQHHGLHPEIERRAGERVATSQNASPRHVQVGLRRVVVDIADDLERRVRVEFEEASEVLAGVAGAVHDHSLGVAGMAGAAAGHRSGDEPAREHQGQCSRGNREGDTSGVSVGCEEEEEDGEGGSDTGDDRAQGQCLVEGRDLVAPLIELGRVAERDLEEDGRGRVREHNECVFGLKAKVVAREDQCDRSHSPAQDVPQRQAETQ